MSQLNETLNVAGNGFGVAVIGGAALWLANRVMGKAAFQNAITGGFAELHKLEQDARAALHNEIDSLRADMKAERTKALAEMQAERQRCDENLAKVARIVAGLKKLLEQHGIDVPEEGVLLQDNRNET